MPARGWSLFEWKTWYPNP